MNVIFKNHRLTFSVYAALRNVIPKNLKGRSKTAQDWLTRQINDPYIVAAKTHNFRCRSAYKLLEIDEKYRFLKPGHKVVDCGAAPGSWSQVLATLTNANEKEPKLPVGKVIGIDRLHIFPVEGATFLQRDLTDRTTYDEVKKLLNNDEIDVVLSDMAPNATGVKDFDQRVLVNMAKIVLRFAVLNSKIGGSFLIKLWQGQDVAEFNDNVKRFYSYVKVVKPKASRSDSSELFLLCRNFKGIKKETTSS